MVRSVATPRVSNHEAPLNAQSRAGGFGSVMGANQIKSRALGVRESRQAEPKLNGPTNALGPKGIWSLLALNFFMADMQAGTCRPASVRS
jgi:hypothetical protein